MNSADWIFYLIGGVIVAITGYCIYSLLAITIIGVY